MKMKLLTAFAASALVTGVAFEATPCCGADSIGRAMLPAFGEPIPATGYDPKKPDVGMASARVFDAPIAGLEKIGRLRIPSSREMPAESNASVGFEGLDRKLFNATDSIYEKLGACGVKRARVQTMWSRCEPEKGRYDFSVLDEVVSKLEAQGIIPWFCVSFGNVNYMTNCYAKSAVGCAPIYYGPECRAAWLRFVGELAKRYRGRVKEWEIWNEPNIDHFWQPRKPSAKDYLELVKITGAAIRAQHPKARIGGTSASPGILEWHREFFDLGGAKEIDFFCTHAYSQVPEKLRHSQREIPRDGEPDYVLDMAGVRRFIDERGGRHVEIWQGESGFPSWFPKGHWLFPKGTCQEGWQSQANQAKWLLRRWLTDRRAGLAISSFYHASDITRHYSMGHTTQSHPAEHGLLNGWTHEPKMSYYAMGHYNALFATAKIDAGVDVRVSPAKDQGVKLLACAFRNSAGTPIFVYYAPFNFAQSYKGEGKGFTYVPRTDAEVSVPSALAPKAAVLVDMLRGGVYSISGRRESDGVVTFTNLPVVDYPLAIVGRGEISN